MHSSHRRRRIKSSRPPEVHLKESNGHSTWSGEGVILHGCKDYKRVIIAGGEQFWVQDLGKDLEALDDAWAGAVEIVIAIGDEDARIAHGPQVAPARAMRKQRHVLEAV